MELGRDGVQGAFIMYRDQDEVRPLIKKGMQAFGMEQVAIFMFAGFDPEDPLNEWGNDVMLGDKNQVIERTRYLDGAERLAETAEIENDYHLILSLAGITGHDNSAFWEMWDEEIMSEAAPDWVHSVRLRTGSGHAFSLCDTRDEELLASNEAPCVEGVQIMLVTGEIVITNSSEVQVCETREEAVEYLTEAIPRWFEESLKED